MTRDTDLFICIGFEVFMMVTMKKAHLLGCYTMWLL
jgi:hypothetical protein